MLGEFNNCVKKGMAMNDNFKCIYKILRTLEKAMDCPEFDLSQIDHNTLEISKERWARYLEMMADIGYIKELECMKMLPVEQ